MNFYRELKRPYCLSCNKWSWKHPLNTAPYPAQVLYLREYRDYPAYLGKCSDWHWIVWPMKGLIKQNKRIIHFQWICVFHLFTPNYKFLDCQARNYLAFSDWSWKVFSGLVRLFSSSSVESSSSSALRANRSCFICTELSRLTLCFLSPTRLFSASSYHICPLIYALKASPLVTADVCSAFIAKKHLYAYP